MQKSDVFLWLKLNCYSNVSTKKILINSKQISHKLKYKKIHLRRGGGGGGGGGRGEESMEQRETNTNAVFLN